MYARALDTEFARDVRAGLTRAAQKTLPCRYLYDDVGSALFEAITYLPEYGLTRADARRPPAARRGRGRPAACQRHHGRAGQRRRRQDARRSWKRWTGGSWSSTTRSTSRGSALAKCAQDFASIGAVMPLEASYLDGLRQAAERRAPGQTLLVLFLGSTIGNFEPEAAIDFLLAVRVVLQPGDALLLGTDLVKPIEQLLAAYDDPTGVTAAFNLNLLARINRELDADFDLRQFEHVGPLHRGVAAHRDALALEALPDRQHHKRADLIVDFVPNETICTEACHKFLPEQIRTMARTSGFRVEAQWIDREWPFAESLLRAA